VEDVPIDTKKRTFSHFRKDKDVVPKEAKKEEAISKHLCSRKVQRSHIRRRKMFVLTEFVSGEEERRSY
jgi:hypothetical protein